MHLHSSTTVVLAALVSFAASAPISSQYASDLLDPLSAEFDPVVIKRFFKLRPLPQPNTLQPHHEEHKKKWEAEDAARAAKKAAKAKAEAPEAKIRAKSEADPAPLQYNGPIMGMNYVPPTSSFFEDEGKEKAAKRELDLLDIEKPRFPAVLTPIVKIAAVVGAVVIVLAALGLFDSSKNSIPGPRDWSSVAAVKGGNGPNW